MQKGGVYPRFFRVLADFLRANNVELASLYGVLKESKEREMVCTNSGLADTLSAIMEKEINPKGLKQMMNKYRYELEAFGVSFESRRSNGQKFVVIKYDEACDRYLQKKKDTPESASSDSSASSSAALKTSVPFVPCDPVESESANIRDAPINDT